MPKYNNLSTIGTTRTLAKTAVNSPSSEVVVGTVKVEPLMVFSLDRVDLTNEANWMRALDICKPQPDADIDQILSEIGQYQSQIDQSLRSAQAQGTIYAYAIAKRIQLIDQRRLYEPTYSNITEFIKAQELKYPSGELIASRQIWTYKRVAQGLDQMLSLMEKLQGDVPQENLHQQLEQVNSQLEATILTSFMENQASYAERLTRILGLGYCKIDQICRLPSDQSVTALLTGQLSTAEGVVPVEDLTFAQIKGIISDTKQPSALTKGGSQAQLFTRKAAQTLRQVNQIKQNLVELKNYPVSNEERESLLELQKLISQRLLKRKK